MSTHITATHGAPEPRRPRIHRETNRVNPQTGRRIVEVIPVRLVYAGRGPDGRRLWRVIEHWVLPTDVLRTDWMPPGTHIDCPAAA